MVSWNDDAEMKRLGRQRRLRDAEQQRLALGRLAARAITRSFSSSKMCFSTCSSTRKLVSPTSLTRTRRSIWRTIVSMCLSLIWTPWSR